MTGWFYKSSLMSVLASTIDARRAVVVPQLECEGPDTEGLDSEWAPTQPLWNAMDAADATLHAAELRRLAVLQARGDSVFQYIVDTAARIGHTPLAGISLLSDGQVRFKATTGVGLMSVPLDEAPCWVAMNNREHVSVFHALTTDPRFTGGRLTSGPGALQFYAGARLWGGPNVPLGVVWVADRVDRLPTQLQLRTLELLARQTALLMSAEMQQAAA
jgi:hypothetical protein